MRFVVIEKARRGRSGSKYLFIGDGWSTFAFIAPLVWAVWHRFWLGALVFAGLSVSVGLLGSLTGNAGPAFVMGLLVNLLVGLEAGGLRVLHQRWRGARVIAVVHADRLDEAELRFAERPVFTDAGDAPAAPIDRKPAGRHAGANLIGFAPRRRSRPQTGL